MFLGWSIAAFLCWHIFTLDVYVYAARLPLKRHVREGRNNRFGRRATLRAATTTSNSSRGTTSVNDSKDLVYTSTITVGGEDVVVQIDTGSSDLWVQGDPKIILDTGKVVNLTYGKGSISGRVATTEVTFAGYTIPDQAFIIADKVEDIAIDGILGLGPVQGSEIRATLQSALADPFLDRVFASDKSTPNFLSFTLDRVEDPTKPFSSELTIGEIIPGLEAISSQPRLPVQIVSSQVAASGGIQHWAVQLDAFIGPDGKSIPITSGVPGATKPVAVLDSGFSLSQVPKNVADAIYSGVPGAQFLEQLQIWSLPCTAELNISVVLGGQTYPIHPLDTSLSDEGACAGAYQGNTLSFGGNLFDLILGDSFLRNTYTLIDFGDFGDVNVTDRNPPFVQLLSVTDPAQAHQDFLNARVQDQNLQSKKKASAIGVTGNRSIGGLMLTFLSMIVLELFFW